MSVQKRSSFDWTGVFTLNDSTTIRNPFQGQSTPESGPNETQCLEEVTDIEKLSDNMRCHSIAISDHLFH